MKHKLLMLTVALSCTLAGNAMALTKDEYKSGKDRISADYKVNKQKCDGLKSNARDICESEAKGIEKVAKAELESQYKPTPRNMEKVGFAKADAAYDTAKEKCDDMAGNAKDVCVKDAKAAQVKAKEDAKVAKASADVNKAKSEKVADASQDANKAKNEADYKAARERCDALAGAPKDSCVNDAKAKFGMK
ncbi:MAG: hypothetical protein V4718_07575 [Pseudomonadota bacterium]